MVWIRKTAAVMIRRATALPGPLYYSLADLKQRYVRNDAMARACLSGRHTMAVLAVRFGVRYSMGSWLVKAHGSSK